VARVRNKNNINSNMCVGIEYYAVAKRATFLWRGGGVTFCFILKFLVLSCNSSGRSEAEEQINSTELLFDITEE